MEVLTCKDKLIVYPDYLDGRGAHFSVANGFVSRVVSMVAEHNLPDAEMVCKILNDHYAKESN